jgi:hypothetical protein
MKAEAPALGIMKTGDYGDSVFYKVACSCGSTDHDVDFNVEINDGGEISLNTYVTVKSDYWSQVVEKRYDIDNDWAQEFDWAWKDIVNGFVRRVKLTWQLWTKGYVRAESTLLMNEQQALNYAETLKQAIKDLKTLQAKSNGNS